MHLGIKTELSSRSQRWWTVMVGGRWLVLEAVMLKDLQVQVPTESPLQLY